MTPIKQTKRSSSAPLYALLALVASIALSYSALGAFSSFRNLLHGTERVETPFFNGYLAHVIRLNQTQAHIAGVPSGFALDTITLVNPSAKAAGLERGDAVDTLDGLPFLGSRDMALAVIDKRPGDRLDVTFWHQGTSLDEPPRHAMIVLSPQRASPAPFQAWLVQSFLVLMPIFCLLTGLYVVFARPRNPNAWLIFAILAYFHAVFLNPGQLGSRYMPFGFLWNNVVQTSMSICFMLFGVYFPERSPLDRKVPWLKWLLLIPPVLLFPLDSFLDYASTFRFSLGASFQNMRVSLNATENVFAVLAISYGFACLYSKEGDATTSPDARRRLRVLIAGCTVGLLPFFALVAYSMIRGLDVGASTPEWVALSVFTILFAFPVTLAYVVIVQRAMDVRILLRQGTKYFFARQSLWVVTVALATWMSISINNYIKLHEQRRAVDLVHLAVVVAIFIVYRSLGAKRLQARIDQKFFREAYSTEQVLSELSEEARNFTETAPLLETITQRLRSTLHIDRIAVFLLAGDTFQLQYATGTPISPGYMLSLPSNSTTIRNLSKPKAAPANVYRDDPGSWLIDASDAERAALSDLSTELLVPMPGRNRLIGVIALGPKSSEEPYSKIDRQLLQTVASQTGLALENAELLKRLTAELAQRASLNREIEIAREVQERLFPQTYPTVDGVDLAGYCRPAQFVGGDYYDFFLIPQPFSTPEAPANRLAIAVGDISGKGISAALLMASLRASLRSVATLRQPDGSGNQHLATLMKHVNELVYEASTTNRYATFFYAELDPVTKILNYVNAGHNCPVILRRGDPGPGEAIPLEPTGTVVGLLQGADYDQASIQLQPGDTLLAFTDGISEAMTADDEEWGEDRMIAAAQTLLGDPRRSSTAQGLLQGLLADADAFTNGAPQHDDMTILVCTLA
ncbi:GAF domain-containing SpoIIE family protein phosphatase [Granulicella sibirica]|nr:GAF domain-containing SpoIIE family protein phosphatase [Granulicella sibirica]